MIFDLHNDLPTSELSDSEQLHRVHRENETVIYAFWTTRLRDPMAFIENGLRHTYKNRYFAVEDMGFAADGDVSVLAALHPLYCGLTHNEENALAGGALSDGELTDRGKTVLRRLHAAHIAVDAAHLNRKSFFAVADVAEHLIDSHTGLQSFHPHARNLTDEQVHIILARGGIVGLTAVRDFIGSDDGTAYADLIDTFVQKFGIDGACVGTDFNGTEPLRGLGTYEDFPRITANLAQRGYTDRDLRKLLYDNANRYFSDRRTFL